MTLHYIHQFDGCVLRWLRELDIPKLEVLWDGDVFIRPVIDNNVRPMPTHLIHENVTTFWQIGACFERIVSLL